MKYFGNRQNPFKRIDNSELDNSFKAIYDLFGKAWLKNNDQNPVQLLWQRKDALATNELFTLGSSLKKLFSLDPNWTNHQVKIIKNGDINNRNGALFEIIGLGIIDTNIVKVIPARINESGIDGIVEFTNRAKVRLSLKNYGISRHHKKFLTNSKKMEELAISELNSANISSIQIFIDCPKRYPTESDWEILHNSIPQVIKDFQNKQLLLALDDIWIIALNPLNPTGINLHEKYCSYTLLMCSPYHENEEKNLFSKLDEACYNLSKHSQLQSDQIINFVFVHISETVSITNCANWANDYLSTHSEKPITGILLYQPTVITDLNSNSSMIDHCFQIRYNETYTNWINRNPDNSIPIQIPVGTLSQTPSDFKIIIGNEQIGLGNRYIYQSGHHYIKPNIKQDGSIEGNITKLGSGIFTHLVIKPFPNEKSIILSGHFAPEDTLLIL